MPKTNEGKLFDMLKKYLAMKEFNVNRELEVKFGTKGFRQITVLITKMLFKNLNLLVSLKHQSQTF